MRRYVILAVTILACSSPKTNEKIDSVAVVPQQSAPNNVLKEPEQTIVKVEGDAIYKKLNFENVITMPQFDPQTVYVYRESGLDVYGSVDATTTIGHVEYKDKLTLIDKEFANNSPADETKIDGFFGRYIPISFEGKTGYVFSGYLLNFPVPDDSYPGVHVPVREYLVRHFQLDTPVIGKLVYPGGDTLRPSFYVTSAFERGMEVKYGQDYDTIDIAISLPGMSVQEVFLFSRYFIHNFKKYLPEFPGEAGLREVDKNIQVNVKIENGRVTSISILDESGCSFGEFLGAGGFGFSGGC